ncbi:MAG TPA: hypothetical protein VFW59_11670 [Gallionella sp.]|nr:hypothetical protein [Gallionella sp.]
MRKPTLKQRIKAKRRSQSLLVGVTWYNEASWAEVKASATDPECFEDSFEKWKAMAVKARCEFQRSGVRAIECLIDPQDFADWCAQNSLPNNATARAEYVSAVLTAAQG